MAVASSAVSVLDDPMPSRTPPAVRFPAMTMIRLVPAERTRSSHRLTRPAPQGDDADHRRDTRADTKHGQDCPEEVSTERPEGNRERVHQPHVRLRNRRGCEHDGCRRQLPPQNPLRTRCPAGPGCPMLSSAWAGTSWGGPCQARRCPRPRGKGQCLDLDSRCASSSLASCVRHPRFTEALDLSATRPSRSGRGSPHGLSRQTEPRTCPCGFGCPGGGREQPATSSALERLRLRRLLPPESPGGRSV
jgi:hypothetical protein